MGMSSWTGDTRKAYATRSASASTKSRNEIFQSRAIKKEFDPKNITLRESCDSDVNPNANAIIVGLDVTGSMGFIAEHIAKKGLGPLVESVIDHKVVSDPHFMMMGIGDINYDRAPLQATHFEADMKIADQLEEIWLEGGGGGNRFESYDLAWAFAANKTRIDCFDKRNVKGYLFTIGDELPPTSPSRQVLKEEMGISLQADLDAKQHLEAAQERYNVFHVCVREGSQGGQYAKWQELLGKRAIYLSNHRYISEVITSVMQVNEGVDTETVIAQWQDKDCRQCVETALFGPNNQ